MLITLIMVKRLQYYITTESEVIYKGSSDFSTPLITTTLQK